MPTFGPNVVHMAHLHFTNFRNSDKEYFVVMETQDNGLFKVYGLSGKRNHANNVQPKGNDLPYGSAWRIFQELKESKRKKGYDQLGTKDNELLIRKQQLEKQTNDMFTSGMISIFERDQFRNFLSILDPSNLSLVEGLIQAKMRKANAA